MIQARGIDQIDALSDVLIELKGSHLIEINEVRGDLIVSKLNHTKKCERAIWIHKNGKTKEMDLS